jgi:hypothetical protein
MRRLLLTLSETPFGKQIKYLVEQERTWDFQPLIKLQSAMVSVVGDFPQKYLGY